MVSSKLKTFKSYYLEERDFVRSVIYWMIRSESVDDLVQETFIKAWKSFSTFENKSSFRTWIYRIAHNVACDYLRKTKNKPGYTENIDELQGKEEKYEIKDLIDRSLFLLDEKKREVFILYYKMEYNMSEVAALIEIPEGTVKSRLFKAREIVQKFLLENGVEV